MEALEAELAVLTGAGQEKDAAGATAVEAASSSVTVEDQMALALSSLSM